MNDKVKWITQALMDLTKIKTVSKIFKFNDSELLNHLWNADIT
jgi:spermidine/putrescine-binding protein